VEYWDLLYESLTPKRKNFFEKQIPSLSLKHSNTIMTSPSCVEQQEQGHEATATLNHSNLLRERKDDVYKKYEIMQVLGNGSMVRFFLWLTCTPRIGMLFLESFAHLLFFSFVLASCMYVYVSV
jgi:hypothetical protein